jgi:hypothetical protein
MCINTNILNNWRPISAIIAWLLTNQHVPIDCDILFQLFWARCLGYWSWLQRSSVAQISVQLLPSSGDFDRPYISHNYTFHKNTKIVGMSYLMVFLHFRMFIWLRAIISVCCMSLYDRIDYHNHTAVVKATINNASCSSRISWARLNSCAPCVSTGVQMYTPFGCFASTNFCDQTKENAICPILLHVRRI